MNVYLDIDGVLLANDKNPARFADEFIEYVVSKYPTYWLTTHCWHGDNHVVALLSKYFSEQTMTFIRQINPTEWGESKTDGIDFSSPFLWFDDDLFDEEKIELVKHNALENWIEVNLCKNENVLKGFLTSFPILVQQTIPINSSHIK